MASYTGLKFGFSSIVEEIEAMRVLSKDFMSTGTSLQSLKHCEDSLKAIWNGGPAATPQIWEIPQSENEYTTIQTRFNDGSHEAGERTAKNIFGRLSFKWSLEFPRPPRRRPPAFVLKDIASISISLHSEDDGVENCIAKWNFDMGDHQSPGCHFHCQVSLEDGQYFRPPLSIPRLPILFVTPMDALDFLLGELFQEKWYEHMNQSVLRYSKRWQIASSTRLTNLLNWHLEEAAPIRSRCPWPHLKKSKPEADLFLES